MWNLFSWAKEENIQNYLHQNIIFKNESNIKKMKQKQPENRNIAEGLKDKYVNLTFS